MTEPILHFHEHVSGLLSELKKASQTMLPKERFEAVNEVARTYAERLQAYSEQNPEFADHPTFRATESVVRLLSYDYADEEHVSRGEQSAMTRGGGSPTAYVKPVIDYLTFIERGTPL